MTTIHKQTILQFPSDAHGNSLYNTMRLALEGLGLTKKLHIEDYVEDLISYFFGGEISESIKRIIAFILSTSNTSLVASLNLDRNSADYDNVSKLLIILEVCGESDDEKREVIQAICSKANIYALDSLRRVLSLADISQNQLLLELYSVLIDQQTSYSLRLVK